MKNFELDFVSLNNCEFQKQKPVGGTVELFRTKNLHIEPYWRFDTNCFDLHCNLEKFTILYRQSRNTQVQGEPFLDFTKCSLLKQL